MGFSEIVSSAYFAETLPRRYPNANPIAMHTKLGRIMSPVSPWSAWTAT